MLCVEMGRQGWDDMEFMAALEESTQGHEEKQSSLCSICVNQAGIILCLLELFLQRVHM